jgi:mRNA interferase RelE/StbE
MKFQATEQFDSALEKLKNPKLDERILDLIEDIEQAQQLKDLRNIKKLKGYKNAYRLRIGDYRLGFFYENDTLTFDFVGLRKEFYRFFP